MAEFYGEARLEGETEVDYANVPLKKRIEIARKILLGQTITVYAELEGEVCIDVDPPDYC